MIGGGAILVVGSVSGAAALVLRRRSARLPCAIPTCGGSKFEKPSSETSTMAPTSPAPPTRLMVPPPSSRPSGNGQLKKKHRNQRLLSWCQVSPSADVAVALASGWVACLSSSQWIAYLSSLRWIAVSQQPPEAFSSHLSSPSVHSPFSFHPLRSIPSHSLRIPPLVCFPSPSPHEFECSRFFQRI